MFRPSMRMTGLLAVSACLLCVAGVTRAQPPQLPERPPAPQPVIRSERLPTAGPEFRAETLLWTKDQGKTQEVTDFLFNTRTGETWFVNMNQRNKIQEASGVPPQG